MEKNQKTEKNQLAEDLEKIAREGIQADRKHLKKDMCAQFKTYEEWIREYVVNAYDAGAASCTIYGREDENTLTIMVEDDGHGMDRQGVIDFNTIYRSVKKGEMKRVVGQHGVGKLSVAAIPGQCGFKMTTSNGKECWRMIAGCLLEDTPIRLEQLDQVPAPGTAFEITFEKKRSLESELNALRNILQRYVRFLTIRIVIFNSLLEGSGVIRPEELKSVDWNTPLERCSQDFNFSLRGVNYEAVLSLGPPVHEIYQNRVLISDSYNLLSHDLGNSFSMPHLRIRVDSPDFELPFGRHCLRNEGVLDHLSFHLRKSILPHYLNELCHAYEQMALSEFAVEVNEVEEMVCAMLKENPHRESRWRIVKIFSLQNQAERVSLSELKKMVEKSGKIYLENEESTGTDYSLFQAPVLSRIQPAGGKDVLKEVFGSRIVTLSIKDLVFVAPAGSAPPLGKRELNFQKQLRFDKNIMIEHLVDDICAGEDRVPGDGGFSEKSMQIEFENPMSLCMEANQAISDLEDIRWQVNYLVERDGKTPCKSQMFLIDGCSVILNLNHPDIDNMLKLSEKAPALSGHWALAMCLCDNSSKILPSLTPGAREELITRDAVCKCGSTKRLAKPKSWSMNREEDSRAFSKKRFRRMLDRLDFGL